MALPLIRMKRFSTDSRGSASVELVIVLPLLLWALAATAVFFDGFKARYQSEMAAQTVADILSRETALITPAYVEGLNSVYDFLSDGGYESRIRVSSLIWDSTNQRPRLQWSYGTRGLTPLPAQTFQWLQAGDLATLRAAFGTETTFSFASAAIQMPVEDLIDRIPPILPGEAVILVETFALWEPFAQMGMGQMRLSPMVTVRPRFAPWINFEGIEPVYPEADYEVTWTGGGNEAGPDPDPDPDPVDPDPDPTPVSSFSFDNGVATGWSHTNVSGGGPSGSFLGIFGNETHATPVTLQVDLGRGGQNATIAFDLIIADSWDGYSTAHALPRGDSLTVMIDGRPVAMEVFGLAAGNANTRVTANYLDTATWRLTLTRVTPLSGTNFVGSGWADSLWRATLTGENAPRRFTLGFSAGTNSGASDEGFGIDNLSISAAGTGTVAPFIPNPLSVMQADAHTRFARYLGCPEHRIAAPWLTLTGADLPTGLTLTRTAGGTTSVSTCPGITGVGWMNASPHLILNFDSQNLMQTLQLTMNDGNNGNSCDTTLGVRDPHGQWWFNDDMAGFNAGLRIGSAVSGQYAVFIGTFGGNTCDSALTINRF